ncbi:hypothetical protein CPB86DRAFT_738041 [Serendipita vermifera]|nr:hypothetical protein CPB86DRAFT_738041 [Serendipita vermifera]
MEIPPVLFVPHDENYRTPAAICLTDDLITTFGLFDAFQRQVIGYNKQQPPGFQSIPSGNNALGSSSATGTSLAGAAGAAPGVGTATNAYGDDAAGAAKKEKKREKDLYKTLFKDLPGKHDTKRDRYLSDLIMQPAKEGRIMLLDEAMAEMAFTIFDIPQLNNEEEDSKKKKKKRKREQEQGSMSVAPTPAHLPTPGGPLPTKQSTTIKQEIDASMSQRPAKRARQDNYPLPIQQPTPQG